MIVIDKMNNLANLAEIAAAWKSLLKKSDIDVVFLTPEWVSAWWTAFGEDRNLYLLTAKADGELIGVAPLMLSSGIIRFIGTPNSDYADIIAKDKPELWRHFLKYLDDRRSEWSRISLSQIPEKSSSLPFFRAINDAKMMIKEIELLRFYL